MPNKAKLAQFFFGKKISLIFFFVLSFFLGHKIANAIIINNIDDASQWVTSNASVLSIEQDTDIKQEGIGSAKITATQGESSWYDASWSNRKPVTVTYAGSELTNADVLVEIDTASLVSAGKLQSNCDDLRFTDSDGTTDISYWVESGCNTTTTQVWTRVPSIPDGGKTIYFYYGNAGAVNAEETWTGNFLTLNAASCSSGWTSVSGSGQTYENEFIRGGSSYGTTGGSSSHSQGQAQCTSTNTPASQGNLWDDTSTSGRWTPASHTHSGLKVDIDTATNVVPPYLDMIVCSNSELNIQGGQVALFDATAPSGWTRFSALDDKFPRGAAGYGATGGSDSHTHTTTGGYATSTYSASNTTSKGTTGIGVHRHISQNGVTSSASNIPQYVSVVFAEADSNGTFPSSGIVMASAVPPLGWTRFSSLDNKFTLGSDTYGATGGSDSHTHTTTITTGTPVNITYQYSAASYQATSPTHTHSCTTTTDSASNIPPYVETIFIKKNSSAASTTVGSEQQNGANNHTVTDTIDATDFSGYEDISFYVRSDRTGTFTRFEMGESSSSEQTFPITINSANTWELKTWDISAISSAAIDAITKMAFRVTDASTGFVMNFDNVRANSAPDTPTISSPADDTWTNSREFCATATDADNDNYNATFVLSGVGSYDGEIVASGEVSCYTHTSDLNSVSWYANASDTNNYTSGNTSSYVAKIDSVAPNDLSATNSSNDWVTSQPTITLSTPTDATSGINEIRYAWDTNNLETNCSGGTATSAGADLTSTLTQGSHILYLCVSDNAGNVTTWNGTYKWDNGNPLVNITSHISTTYNASNIPSTISGTASDVSSAVASVAVTIYDGVNYWSGVAWDSATRVWLAATNTTNWSLNFTPDKDGDFTLESRSTDSAGNQSSYDTVSFSYDSIAPGISTTPSVSSITDTAATIAWETDDLASTRIQYGPSSSYGKLSTVTDTSPRVTVHSQTLNDLRACATYHYRVLGTDAAGNQVTGTDRTFTTTGCTGSATIEKQTNSQVTASTGGNVSMTDGNNQVDLTIPPSFAAVDAAFQVKKLDKTQVLAAISTPTSTLNAVGNNVYQLDAITEDLDTVTSFNEAITITMTYTDAEVIGLDESTLVIYRWDGSAWHALNDCVVDTEANTVTCSTTAFSTFILFGSEPPSSSSDSNGSSSTTTCDGPAPGNKAPWIYGAIPQSTTSIKLYFADGDGPIQKYLLIYGQDSNNYIYGADNIGGMGDGYRQFTVEELEPGTTYYFRVRGENNCVAGQWSNEFMVRTPTSVGTGKNASGDTPLSIVDSVEITPVNPAQTSQPIVVKPGDSLSLIAQEVFGDADAYPKLIEANAGSYPSLLTNPGYIEVGWQLKLSADQISDQPFAVTLKVVDRSDQAIANARVSFAGQETTLDENGQAIFYDIAEGDYVVALYNDEGLVAERNIHVDSGAESYEVLLRISDRSPWNVVDLPWYQNIIQQLRWYWQTIWEKITSWLR